MTSGLQNNPLASNAVSLSQSYAKLQSAISGNESSKKAEKAAKEFETTFLSTLLKPVFEKISEDAEFGGGNAETTWQSFLVDEYAKSITASGGIGLSESVMRQLLQQQEVSQ